MKTWRRHVTIALLLMVIQAFLCNAREYRIDGQGRFEDLSTATFLPGDIILFKKGQQFAGMFAPSGSGTDEAPITIATYGHGSRPRIDAGGKHLAGLSAAERGLLGGQRSGNLQHRRHRQGPG